jgi:hypothetical protein
MKLPRYVVKREREGRSYFYWQVPPRLRVKDADGTVWPTGLTRLPEGPDMATTAARLNAELDARRNPASHLDRRHGTMPWLIENYEQSSYFTTLRDRTKVSYRELSAHLVRWSTAKNHPPITAMTTPMVLTFLEQYENRRSLRDHIAMYLAVVMEFARRSGHIQINPARRLGLKRAKRLKPIRIVSVEQVLTIVVKAREMGLPHVAMGTLLHFDLGQRQGDVLRLQKPRDYSEGLFRFNQSKTDQVVTILPFLHETRAALEALPAAQFMLVAGPDGLAVNPSTYSREFRRVACACGFADLWEMELRHSCVIYMERAGLTPAEIATRTGHALQSVIMILENYRYRDPVVAHQGALKLEAYRNKKAV